MKQREVITSLDIDVSNGNRGNSRCGSKRSKERSVVLILAVVSYYYNSRKVCVFAFFVLLLAAFQPI